MAVKEFAETASTEVLDKQKQQIIDKLKVENPKTEDFVVLDGFTSPPIESGVGSSSGSLFVDGNHTMVRKNEIFEQESTYKSMIIFRFP